MQLLFRASLAASLIVSMPFYGITASGGTQLRDPCLDSIPTSLQETIKRDYPEWKVVTLDLLVEYDKKLFLEENKGRCPGVVKVDFYGEGSDVLAIILTKGSGYDRKVRLIIGRENVSRQWQLTTLNEADVARLPAVLAVPPGVYKDVHGKRVLKAKHAAILFVGYESWAIVYAWTGRNIDKVWVAD